MISEKYSKYTNEELMRIVRQDNKEALDYLIKKFTPLVKQKARAYFLIGGSQDDVIQEGMIGLYKAAKDFNEDIVPNFRGFANICIQRQIITAVKAANRLKHTPLNTYISFYSTINENDERIFLDIFCEDFTSNPEKVLMSKEHIKEMENSIKENLSKMELKVLSYYLKGLDYHEIANIMDKESKAIDNALQRIRKKISGLI